MEMLIRDATSIINCAAWRMFAAQCDIPYPGSFCADLIRIFAPDIKSAKHLYKEKRERLALACREWEQSMVEIFWSTDHRPLPISATCNECQSGESLIMTTNITLPDTRIVAPRFTGIKRYSRNLLREMDKALESGDRISIVRLSDQVQVFITDSFSEMLQTPPDIAVGRTMKVGWRPVDLNNCMRQAQQETRFQITYTSGLNPTTCAVLDAEVTIIDEGYEQYRVNRNLDCRVIDWPDDMRILTSFDW